MARHNHAKQERCTQACPVNNVRPLPGMPPAPPEPEMSDKAQEVLAYLIEADLTGEEFGEVMAALLLSKLTGSLTSALKEMGVDMS